MKRSVALLFLPLGVFLSCLLLPKPITDVATKPLVPVAVNTHEHEITTLSNDTVVVGVDRTSAKPYLELNKWDGEVSLKVDIPYRVASTPVRQGNKLVYRDISNEEPTLGQKSLALIRGVANADEPSADVQVYTHEPKKVVYEVGNQSFSFIENEQGGVEFDVVLNDRPLTNVLNFPIDADHLEFSYQPPLTEEPMMPGTVRCTETTCFNEADEVTTFRPENVVGSYAVYYDGGKSGDWTKAGGKNYKTGKVFHIYRPKIFDAAGKETWGILKVDGGILSVTVPEEFLATATYPVIVDPTFGYTSIGVTSSSWTATYPRGAMFALSEDGEAQSITMYTKGSTSGTHSTQFAIYDSASTATLKGNTATLTNSNSADGAWVTGAITPATLTAGTYRLVSNHPAGSNYYVYYDSATNPNYPMQYRANLAFGTWSNPLGSWTQFAYQRVSSYVTYGSASPDVTPPTVSLTLPTNGAATSSTVVLAATASDETSLAGVKFYVNSVLQGSEDTSSPYSISWDSTATSSGSKTILAVARDASNNYATSSAVSITVDNTAPTVSVTAPTSGASVSGTSDITADASDGSGISGVSFYVNGVLQNSEDVSSPYSISWNSTATTSGAKSVVAVARDALGNRATSSAVSFTTTNAPTPTSVSAAMEVPHEVITWTTALAASSRVYFGPTTSYGSSTAEQDTSPRVTSHSVTLMELPACTYYHYIVVGTDAYGNTATSSDNTFYTDGCTGDSNVTATNAGSITTASGGTLAQGNLTLSIPTSFTATSTAATFQANQLSASTFFSEAGTPSGKSRAGDTVFNLKALVDATTTLSSFIQPLEVTLTYEQADMTSVDESTLWIHRYDGSAWYPLDACVVDQAGNEVTCTTTNFSDFAIFGEAAASSPVANSSTVVSGSSGTTIQARVNNLISLGDVATAKQLIVAYSSEFASSSAVLSSTTMIKQDQPRVFSRDLKLGMEGEDVKMLQAFIVSQAKGPSAKELARVKPSGYFGRYTKNALGEWQRTVGIRPAAGYFGPITRSQLGAIGASGF